MFNALSAKIYVQVLAFSMLLFSSYKGNDVLFSDIKTKITGDNIVFQTYLKQGFDNDFDEIFKSGKPIRVWFEIKVIKEQKIVHYEKFYHQVVWNSTENRYNIELQEQNYSLSVNNFKELKYYMSVIEYPFYKLKANGSLTVEFISYLPKIYLDSIDKEIDLMLLWKMKKPKVRYDFRI